MKKAPNPLFWLVVGCALLLIIGGYFILVSDNKVPQIMLVASALALQFIVYFEQKKK